MLIQKVFCTIILPHKGKTGSLSSRPRGSCATNILTNLQLSLKFLLAIQTIYKQLIISIGNKQQRMLDHLIMVLRFSTGARRCPLTRACETLRYDGAQAYLLHGTPLEWWYFLIYKFHLPNLAGRFTHSGIGFLVSCKDTSSVIGCSSWQSNDTCPHDILQKFVPWRIKILNETCLRSPATLTTRNWSQDNFLLPP